MQIYQQNPSKNSTSFSPFKTFPSIFFTQKKSVQTFTKITFKFDSYQAHFCFPIINFLQKNYFLYVHSMLLFTNRIFEFLTKISLPFQFRRLHTLKSEKYKKPQNLKVPLLCASYSHSISTV